MYRSGMKKTEFWRTIYGLREAYIAQGAASPLAGDAYLPGGRGGIAKCVNYLAKRISLQLYDKSLRQFS